MAEHNTNHQQVADMLWQAAHSGVPCAPVRNQVKHDDIDAAYAIQQINIQRALSGGGRLVGRKIGLTAKTVQQQLGVDQPDFGCLLADMAVSEGEEIEWHRVMQPKVEAEVALVLAHDLSFEKHTIADLIKATAYVLPALEIVSSRIQDWDIRLVDTVADNASCGVFVLGNRPVKLSEVDLIRCGMVIEHKGEPVSVGIGAACLGNPLYAALWLADTLSMRGAPLCAGDVILTGALGPMVSAKAGDVFHAHIHGLGSVSAYFAQNNEGSN